MSIKILPLVSLLLPAYNHQPFLAESINSAIAQSYSNLELLIVDDGSSDGTYEIARSMRTKCEKRFRRFVLLTQPNMGTSATLAKLFAMAEGEYACGMASDDVLMPDAVEVLVGFLEEHQDYGLAIGNNGFIDQNSRPIYLATNKKYVTEQQIGSVATFGEVLQRNRPDIPFDSDSFGGYASLLVANYIPNGYAVRRKLLATICSFSSRVPLEDYHMMLQVAKYARIKYIDKVLFLYRQHAHNTASQSAHMLEMTKKTIAAELDILNAGELLALPHTDKSYLAVLRRKKLFEINGLLSLQKAKSYFYKWFELNLLGKRYRFGRRRAKRLDPLVEQIFERWLSWLKQ